MTFSSSQAMVSIFQKPDTIDTLVYEKPNAYDEEPPVIITANRYVSRSSQMTVDSFASRYFERRESGNSVSRRVTRSPTDHEENYNSPHTPVVEEEKVKSRSSQIVDYNKHITSCIISQSTPTTRTSFDHDELLLLLKDAHAHYMLHPSPGNSVITDTTIATETLLNRCKANAVSSNTNGIISSSLLQQTKLHACHKAKKDKNNVIVYSFKKASLLKPNQHHIFLKLDEYEEIMAYRKIQPSSSWGFQSMLYCNRNDGQGVKVAEARRGAFQKEIIIETADYKSSLVQDIAEPYLPTLRARAIKNDTHYCCQEPLLRRCSDLNNTLLLLFEYETWFRGSLMRWKRPSLLSHDFTCEIKLTREETKQLQMQEQKQRQESLRKRQKRESISKMSSVVRVEDNVVCSTYYQHKDGSNFGPVKTRYLSSSLKPLGTSNVIKEDGFIDSDSDNDEDDHDNHSHKTCRRWKLIAEFHHNSSTKENIGKLSIDLDILNQVEKERCDLLEANVIMICCTLIDMY